MPANKMHKLKRMKLSKKLVFIIIAIVLLFGLSFAILLSQTDEDCTSYEIYDNETGECYYECDTEEECREIEAKIDAELNGYFTEARTKLSSSNKPIASGIDRSGDENHIFTKDETGSDTDGVIYTVRADKTFIPKPSSDDLNILKLVQQIIPTADYRKYLETIEVFDDSQNDFAAMVWQSNTPGKWHMSINKAFSEDKNELILTIVHEYGHIISLDSTQVEAVSGACPRFELDEGCVKEGAYIKRFTEQYWHKFGAGAPADGASDDEVGAFYQSYEDDFISDYAATNAVEDFAESFANFVVFAKPDSTTPVYNEKIYYMYEYPQLTKIRDSLRANINRYIK